jgi:hypothetical protein
MCYSTIAWYLIHASHVVCSPGLVAPARNAENRTGTRVTRVRWSGCPVLYGLDAHPSRNPLPFAASPLQRPAPLAPSSGCARKARRTGFAPTIDRSLGLPFALPGSFRWRLPRPLPAALKGCLQRRLRQDGCALLLRNSHLLCLVPCRFLLAVASRPCKNSARLPIWCCVLRTTFHAPAVYVVY